MKNVINKHKSNKIKENSNTVRHLNNGTDRRHSKSCCDQSSPARRTIKRNNKWLNNGQHVVMWVVIWSHSVGYDVTACNLLHGLWYDRVMLVMKWPRVMTWVMIWPHYAGNEVTACYDVGYDMTALCWLWCDRLSLWVMTAFCWV